MRNIGKKFEDNFKKSIPDDIMQYRLPDAAQSFAPSSGLRFSNKNPCDCFIYDYPTLFTLELKSVGMPSISFEKTKEDKGKVIHYHQIEGLRKFAKYKGVISGFVINFRHKDDTETCYFLHIKGFDRLIDGVDKKSFNEKDLQQFDPIVIENAKLKVNYRYDVSKFITDARHKYEKNLI